MQVTSYCVAHIVEQVHDDCGFDLKRLKGIFFISARLEAEKNFSGITSVFLL